MKLTPIIFVDNIKIKLLKSVPLEKIHHSWIRAFGDYQVNVQWSVELLGSLFRQNDVCPEVSVGAYDGDELIGFWMNGFRNIDGRKLAYDSGTALWPEYRGKGISKLLAEESGRVLRENGVGEYILEVITTNEIAYNLYLQDGFKVTRKFNCYKAEKSAVNTIEASNGFQFEEGILSSLSVKNLPKAEYEPSWQNTLSAMGNVSNSVHVVVAKKKGVVVGFGAVKFDSGRISQLAFYPEFWETGLPEAVLVKLSKVVKTSDIMMVNVEDGALQTNRFLLRNGFKTFVQQYEMKKDL